MPLETRSRRPTPTSSTCLLQLSDGRPTDGQRPHGDFRKHGGHHDLNLGSHFCREEKDPARVRGSSRICSRQALRPEF